MEAFVTIITRSTALNYCKSNTRKKSELIGDEKIDFLFEPIEIENDKIEFKILIESITEKLTKKERILFTMRYINYYSPEEISKIFKVTRNAIDNRLNRLKNKIKKFLIDGGISL